MNKVVSKVKAFAKSPAGKAFAIGVGAGIAVCAIVPSVYTKAQALKARALAALPVGK